jgi:hypothetical protein
MPKHLFYSQFTTIVARRRDLGLLERVVVNKFHYVLLPNHKYYNNLLKIYNIA